MDNMKRKLNDKNIKVLCSDLFKEWEQDRAYHSTGYVFRAFAIDLFS